MNDSESDEPSPSKTMAVVGKDLATRVYVREALRAADYLPLEPVLIVACSQSQWETEQFNTWHARYAGVAASGCSIGTGPEQIEHWHAKRGVIPMLVLPLHCESMGKIEPADLETDPSRFGNNILIQMYLRCALAAGR